MDTNNSKKVGEKVLFPELSYKINGILFSIHNELGSFSREKQYGDLFELKLKEDKIDYKREVAVSNSGNIIDFVIEDKILLELKTVRVITRDCYRQTQNYLQQTSIKLGLLVNFRSKYLRIVRIIKIDNRE